MDNNLEIATDPDSDTVLPSCGQCRRRKLKCSRQQPSCSNCQRLDTECVYDIAKTKPGLKSGAVEALSRRLEAIESHVFDQSSQRQHDRNFDGSELTSSYDQPRIVNVLSTLSREIQLLTSTLGSTLRTLPNSSNHPSGAENEDEYNDARPRKRARQLDTSTQPIVSGTVPRDEFQYSDGKHTNPPSIACLDALLAVYFAYMQPWVPIVHEAAFRRKISTPEGQQQMSLVLHAMVFAALRLVKTEDGQPLDAAYVREETTKSRNIVRLNAMEELSVENLQALAILAFTEIGNGAAHKAWPLIGSLTRTVEYLQLTVELDDLQKRNGLLRSACELHDPVNWVEEEERRRVFWNIFILDRFCSVTTGSNTSLTSADVSRRLPICGGHWYRETPAATPYFGIWDRSVAGINKSITFLPAHHWHTSPSTNADINEATSASPTGPRPVTSSETIDMSTVGAFAYFVESMESLSRVVAYFIHQKINFDNRQEVSSWLVRFKELDLRLVHWKMFLPQQWKDSGVSRRDFPGVMDPNMTVAHATHNASMILLHQSIAYPGPDLQGIKLPSSYSADTCQHAAIETANITSKYLETTFRCCPVSPQLGFSAFVSGRVLLFHWRHLQADDVDAEFWVLVRCLENMSLRWAGADGQEDQGFEKTFFGQLASRLRRLYLRHQQDHEYRMSVSEYEEEVVEKDLRQMHTAESTIPRENSVQAAVMTTVSRPFNPSLPPVCSAQSWEHPQGSTGAAISHPYVTDGDDLSAISRILMDHSFTEMDRVISFENMNFNSHPNDMAAGFSSQWSDVLGGSQTGGGWPSTYVNTY